MSDSPSIKPGYLPTLTEEQKQILANIKENLKNEINSYYTDETLCRFLRARKFDIVKTTEMLKKDIEWRKQMKPEEILENFPNSRLGRLCLDYWPGKQQGFDKRGNPLYFEKLGAVDARGWTQNISLKDSIEFHIYLMESSRKNYQINREKGIIPVDGGTVYIQDLQGLGMKHMYKPAMNVLKVVMTMDNEHYPETLDKVYIINAPTIFNLFWKIFKPFLDPATVEKIEFLGSDFLQVFEQRIDRKFIPKYLGGDCPEEELYIPRGGDFGSSSENLGIDMITIISAGKKFEKEIEIEEEGTLLGWEFHIEEASLGFSVVKKEEKNEIHEYSRHESGESPIQGHIVAESVGTYVLSWDNSFSMFRKKTLRYNIDVQKPEKQVDPD